MSSETSPQRPTQTSGRPRVIALGQFLTSGMLEKLPFIRQPMTTAMGPIADWRLSATRPKKQTAKMYPVQPPDAMLLVLAVALTPAAHEARIRRLIIKGKGRGDDIAVTAPAS